VLYSRRSFGDVLRRFSATSHLVWGYVCATAQVAGFDPDSREFEAALDYLVDVGYLVPTGDERERAFRITVEGINEVQRRPQL
jgi:hypothetical protein